MIFSHITYCSTTWSHNRRQSKFWKGNGGRDGQNAIANQETQRQCTKHNGRLENRLAVSQIANYRAPDSTLRSWFRSSHLEHESTVVRNILLISGTHFMVASDPVTITNSLWHLRRPPGWTVVQGWARWGSGLWRIESSGWWRQLRLRLSRGTEAW